MYLTNVCQVVCNTLLKSELFAYFQRLFMTVQCTVEVIERSVSNAYVIEVKCYARYVAKLLSDSESTFKILQGGGKVGYC